MLDQPQRWASLTDFGNIPTMKQALLGRQQSDRRILNMKLKQRALTGKPQDKRFISSASALQRWEQRRYPMDYSREDSTRASLNHQTIRKQLEKRVQKARIDSGGLREHSLNLFDSVVKNLKNSDVKSETKPYQKPTKSTFRTNIAADEKENEKSVRPQSAMHNGPSHDGSLLYNKRGQVLNSIRLRPKSEPVSKFNHEKGKLVPPDIKKTLCQSNNEFRVLSTSLSLHPPSARSRSSSASDFKLVPLNGPRSVSEISSVHDFKTDGAVRLDLDNDNVFVEVDELEMSRASSQMSNDIAFRKRNMPSGTVHLYSLEYESSSEGSLPEMPPTEETKPTTGASDDSKSRGKKAKQQKSAKKKKEPETQAPQEAEAAKDTRVRKPLKGPKCWVDDATVSSESDEKADPEIIVGKDRPVSVSKSATILDKTPANIDTVGKAVPQNIQGPTQLDNQNIDNQNISDFESIDDTPSYLPKFVCPSSVRKSKQAAIKEWLATTNFRHAERCVPLL